MAKNKVVRDTKAVNVAEGAPIPPGNAPPKDNAPAPPDSWKKSKRVKRQEGGLKPTASQADASVGAATEMQESTTWVDDFGSKAPDPKVLANNLVTASQWRDAWVLASKWLAYCVFRPS
jgi:hypothetical protein